MSQKFYKNWDYFKLDFWDFLCDSFCENKWWPNDEFNIFQHFGFFFFFWFFRPKFFFFFDFFKASRKVLKRVNDYEGVAKSFQTTKCFWRIFEVRLRYWEWWKKVTCIKKWKKGDLCIKMMKKGHLYKKMMKKRRINIGKLEKNWSSPRVHSLCS